MSTESIVDHFLNFVFNFLNPTFRYQSLLWENHETFNLSGGETGFDGHETKLPTYWNTSFSKICLGMKIHGQEKVNFTVINKTADSLYSLIADGQYRLTSLGRDTWKALIGPQASLQTGCNKEGFNAFSKWRNRSKARIGFLGNNENDCDSCNSRIGFGTDGESYDNTCGNEAKHGADEGDKSIIAMGYILRPTAQYRPGILQFSLFFKGNRPISQQIVLKLLENSLN